MEVSAESHATTTTPHPPLPPPLPQARELWYPLNRRLGGPRVDMADSKRKISCAYWDLNLRPSSL